MKSKRRHELHTNALADWLGKHVGTALPFGRWLGLGLVLIILAIVVITIGRSHSESRLANGWSELEGSIHEALIAAGSGSTANDPGFDRVAGQIETLAGEFPGTSLAAFANSRLADLYLARGESQMNRDRDAALQNFNRAVSHYGAAVEAAEDPLLKERILFSMGEAYEWMFQLNEAKQTYERVKDLKGLLAANAQKRIIDLDRPASTQFYKKLRSFEPKRPSMSDEQLEGAPGARFGDSFKLPPLGDLPASSGSKDAEKDRPLTGTPPPLSRTPDTKNKNAPAPAVKQPESGKPAPAGTPAGGGKKPEEAKDAGGATKLPGKAPDAGKPSAGTPAKQP